MTTPQRLALACALAGLAAGSCAPSGNAVDRIVEDTARGVRYTCPAHWTNHDGEIRSAQGTLLTLRVYDLVEADKRFVAGLPDTMLPQLQGWAEYYFVVDGPPTRVETTVAGIPATEWNYPIRVRPKDPLSKVTYWVVKRETRLFILRAAYPPRGLAADEPEMRRVVAGWSFL